MGVRKKFKRDGNFFLERRLFGQNRKGPKAGSKISQNLDTCSKNDVILFSRKRFCALGLLGIEFAKIV